MLLLVCTQLGASAQDLNGIKIQVAADALTYLKFHDEIKRFEFGGAKDDYTGQVVESEQLRIKTLNNNPTPTNLVVTEGSRTHIFIIEVMKKIDINKFKAYYDFSDLKALKKLANSHSSDPSTITYTEEAIPITATSAKKDNASSKDDKKARRQAADDKKAQDKAQKQQEEQDRKDQDEANKKIAQAAKDKTDAKARQEAAAKEQARLKQEAAVKAKEDAAEQKRMLAAQAQRDKDAAAAKARAQQAAKEEQQTAALAKKREEQEEKQRRQDEKDQQAREARRKSDIAAAKEKDRQAAIAKADAQRKKEEADRQQVAQARADQKARDEAIVAANEKQRRDEAAKEAAAEAERSRQDAIARKKQDDIAKERARRDEAIKQQQIAQEKEQQRQAEAERKAAIAKEEARVKQEAARQLAAAKAKERADGLIKNPYWKSEWHTKYPQINFGEGPVGQQYAGEYFLPRDTVYNSNAANALIRKNGTLKKNYEAAAGGVKLKMVNLGFSGVNVYLQLRITNNSDKDFLVGKMQLTWWKKEEGGGLYLNPVYVTDFPVVPAGKDMTIIFGCHGVNARDEDDFAFTMNERITNTELKVLFPANLYNKQMLLKK